MLYVCKTLYCHVLIVSRGCLQYVSLMPTDYKFTYHFRYRKSHPFNQNNGVEKYFFIHGLMHKPLDEYQMIHEMEKIIIFHYFYFHSSYSVLVIFCH